MYTITALSNGNTLTSTARGLSLISCVDCQHVSLSGCYRRYVLTTLPTIRIFGLVPWTSICRLWHLLSAETLAVPGRERTCFMRQVAQWLCKRTYIVMNNWATNSMWTMCFNHVAVGNFHERFAFTCDTSLCWSASECWSVAAFASTRLPAVMLLCTPKGCGVSAEFVAPVGAERLRTFEQTALPPFPSISCLFQLWRRLTTGVSSRAQ